MKKLVSISLMVLFSGSVAFAQTTPATKNQQQKEKMEAIKKAAEEKRLQMQSKNPSKPRMTKEEALKHRDSLKKANKEFDAAQKERFKANESLRKDLEAKVKSFAPVRISAPMKGLTEREKKLVKKLCQAGHVADKIFWQQTSHDAIAVRDSLKKLLSKKNNDIDMKLVELQYKFLMLNYGPYDILNDNERFVGPGSKFRLPVGNFYPIDMTKEEFESYVKANPAKKDALESQYTVVQRQGKDLVAVPYHAAYPETKELARLIREAAELADDAAFKAYLTSRAKAIESDEYFDSDMLWMDMKDSKIDFVIGPIENYEDALFNYKTAYEAVVMIKDSAATQQFEQFKSLIDFFEANLPTEPQYIRKKAGSMDGSQINIVNVAFFGGDCNNGVKTIAASLPNDPKVRDAKGGKNNMYKNLMEAKFDKIVVPIAKALLTPEWVKYVDKYSFTSFVSLHEVSHTLGRDYVFGNDQLTVRKALQEKYSGIEEAKADILSMYNHKHLIEKGLLKGDGARKAMATYLAGLYRSIRFGAEAAHGVANMIQLNYLRETGAIVKDEKGKLSINEQIFFDKVGELAKKILTIQAKGDYQEAVRFMEKYGKISDEVKKEVEQLKSIPRDLNSTYEF